MTEAREVQPGVHLARGVLDNDGSGSRIRMVNLNEKPATLAVYHIIGELHPVEIEPCQKPCDEVEPTESDIVEKLMASVSVEVPQETKARLAELLDRYRDIFSVSEQDLGKNHVIK